MDKDNLWGGSSDSDFDLESGPETENYRTSDACKGVHMEPEGSTSSFDWGQAISIFFLVGGISIIGHLVNMWRN